MTARKKQWVYRTVNFSDGKRASFNFGRNTKYGIVFPNDDAAKVLKTTGGALKTRKNQLVEEGSFKYGEHFVYLKRTVQDLYGNSPEEVMTAREFGRKTRPYGIFVFTPQGLRQIAASYLDPTSIKLKRAEEAFVALGIEEEEAPKKEPKKKKEPPENWSDLVKAVCEKEPMLSDILEHARCEMWTSSELVLSFANNKTGLFCKKGLDNKDTKVLLESTLADFDLPLKIKTKIHVPAVVSEEVEPECEGKEEPAETAQEEEKTEQEKTTQKSAPRVKQKQRLEDLRETLEGLGGLVGLVDEMLMLRRHNDVLSMMLSGKQEETARLRQEVLELKETVAEHQEMFSKVEQMYEAFMQEHFWAKEGVPNYSAEEGPPWEAPELSIRHRLNMMVRAVAQKTNQLYAHVWGTLQRKVGEEFGVNFRQLAKKEGLIVIDYWEREELLDAVYQIAYNLFFPKK